MLLVTLSIVPFGRWEDKYDINNIYIANMCGDSSKANYHAWFDKDPTADYENRPEPDVIIKGFKRQKGAMELLRQVLNKWYTKQEKKEKRRANISRKSNKVSRE